MQLASSLHGSSLQPSCSSRRPQCSVRQPAVCRAAKTGGAGGFDSKSTKKKTSYSDGLAMTRDGFKRINMDDFKDDASSSKPQRTKSGAPKDLTGWSSVCKVSDFVAGKITKPLILTSGKSIMLYKLDNRIFCSDSSSTAYQYPLVDAQVSQQGDAVVVTVPLDGTQYDLRTGEVLTWCPNSLLFGTLYRDNPVRNFLGTLKKDVQPTPLKVYEVHVAEDQTVWVKITV